MADNPGRAMVIMAHPDDIEWFVGGTVASWTSAGVEVTYVLVTSGDAGGADRRLDPEQLAALREAEQAAAADGLGVRRVIFLREPDGEVIPSLELRRRLVIEIRRYRPEVIITFDPQRYCFPSWINHPDHRAVGDAVLAALASAAGNWRYHPEMLAGGLQPHKVSQLWLAWPARPEHWVDVTAYFPAKLAAQLCHHSQAADAQDVEQRLRQFCGVQEGRKEVVYREGFQVLRMA